MAERVGVRELRQNLSVYLRKVETGVSYEVTDRGRSVALLVPLPSTDDPIDRLAVEGRLVSRATRSPGDIPPPIEWGIEPSASEILQELREDRS